MVVDESVACCANCVYCVPYEEPSEFATVAHECRRYPPQTYGANPENAFSAFPGVKEEVWCGEYVERGSMRCCS